jgi:hypothetical protein
VGETVVGAEVQQLLNFLISCVKCVVNSTSSHATPLTPNAPLARPPVALPTCRPRVASGPTRPPIVLPTRHPHADQPPPLALAPPITRTPLPLPRAALPYFCILSWFPATLRVDLEVRFVCVCAAFAVHMAP